MALGVLREVPSCELACLGKVSWELCQLIPVLRDPRSHRTFGVCRTPPSCVIVCAIAVWFFRNVLLP